MRPESDEVQRTERRVPSFDDGYSVGFADAARMYRPTDPDPEIVPTAIAYRLGFEAGWDWRGTCDSPELPPETDRQFQHLRVVR